MWCATFVVLDAAQAVLFGRLLQGMDSLALGFCVFGLSAALCLAVTSVRAPSEFRAAWAAPGTLAALNVSSAVGWLAYLGALQLIEPAVAFTIFSGVIPLVIVAARAGLPHGDVMHGPECAGFAILALGLVALGVSTLAGLSGFVRGDTGIAALGLALAALAGVAMAGMVLASYRLSARGIGPAAVFGLRFPLYLVLAGAGALIGFDDKGTAVASDEFLVAVVIGLAVLAFPIYAVQKAVSLTSAATLGAATALIPVAVLALQAFDQRVSYSGATAAGLAIYTLGALLAATARARDEVLTTGCCSNDR